MTETKPQVAPKLYFFCSSLEGKYTKAECRGNRQAWGIPPSADIRRFLSCRGGCAQSARVDGDQETMVGIGDLKRGDESPPIQLPAQEAKPLRGDGFHSSDPTGDHAGAEPPQRKQTWTDKVLELLLSDPGLSSSEVSAALNYGHKNTAGVLTAMAKDGRVVAVGNTPIRYELPGESAKPSAASKGEGEKKIREQAEITEGASEPQAGKSITVLAAAKPKALDLKGFPGGGKMGLLNRLQCEAEDALLQYAGISSDPHVVHLSHIIEMAKQLGL